jgi:hypothetical protein
MPTAIAKLELLAPYCQSRFHSEAKLPKELSDDYEKRTWRKRLHVDTGGEIVIPAMALSNCIKEAAKFLGLQIPGKGKATWTKQFESGVAVFDDIRTGRMESDAIEQKMFVPSTGVRGDGKRVMKSYPLLMPPLEVEVTFLITNDMITPEVFAHHLQQAGSLIGIGAFRVRNNGVYGRFKVNSIDWYEDAKKAELPTINVIKKAA